MASVVMLQGNSALAITHYVNLTSANPVSPYSDWSTAATNIQDAIDTAVNGDLVLVSNGTYSTGGTSMDGILSNRVTLNKAVTVESVNGPWATIIQGVGTTNGSTAVRCAWLTNDASLIGFTLKWGATATSGSISVSQSGGALWCASSSASVANCVIVSNVCAYQYGAGAYQGDLNNCLIENNSSGVYAVIANNCTIISNSGAAVYGSSVVSLVTNCILYYNNTLFETGVFSHCCTASSVTGIGNFTNAPLFFADGIHLETGSPCIGAGAGVATGTDIFGQPWASPPSIGCAEWQPAPAVGTLNVQLNGAPPGFTIGNIPVDGQAPFTYSWLQNGMPLPTTASFASIDTNSLTATGITLTDAGSYQLIVSNEYGSVTSAPVTLTIHCVDANGTSPLPPYLSWATAANNVQDAIDAATTGDIVLVTNGVYDTGGKSMDGALTNRVTLDKALIVTSVNGCSVTAIEGAWDPLTSTGPLSVRCAWLTNGAVLNGFTLCNGSTLKGGMGGGAWCSTTNAILSNCLLTNNIAVYGGGIANGAINNSLLIGNTGTNGQAAYSATLNQCTVRNTLAQAGFSQFYPATYQCVVRNSIVVGYNENFSALDTYDYSCTEGPAGTSQMPFGVSNIALNPEFLDSYHISTTSPCRGAGNTSYSFGTDLDGEPWASPPSMGCDEVVPANRTGVLLLDIISVDTNVVVNTSTAYYVTIEGSAATVSWSFSGGMTISNVGNLADYTWTNAGNQTVTVTAYNETYPNGVSASLPVDVFPSPITNSPAYVTGNIGGNETFEPVSPITLSGPFSFQWYLDGIKLTNGNHYAGSQSSSLTISNLQSGDAGSYYLVVSNPFVLGSNLVDVLSVQYVAPSISPGEPASAAVYIGGSVSLTATAVAGTVPISYEWFDGTTALHDTNEYSGSATPTLTINPAGFADAGGYTLVISNAGGSATSQVANITVLALPSPSYVAYASAGSNYVQTFDSLPYQPTNSINATNPVSINGSVYSLGNPFDFAFLAETNGAGGLALSNTMNGWYGFANDAVFFGATAGDQTNGGVLNFGSTNDPVSATNRSLGLLATGSTGPTAFSVRLINVTGYTLGQFNLSYTSELWRQAAIAKVVTNFYYLDLTGTNGFPTNVVSGSLTNLTFPPGNLAWGAGGPLASMYVELDNQSFATNWPAGAALWVVWEMGDSGDGGQGIGIANLTFSAGLATNLAPVITMGPQSQSVTEGQMASFSVAVSNLLADTYQWFTNGAPLSDGNEIGGSTSATLTINPVMFSDDATYWVVVSNAYGSATSIPVSLTVNVAVAAPGFLTQPQSLTNIVGSNAVFTAMPTGTQPISYQWQFDGTNISGATDITLELTNLDYAESGSYSLALSNSAGTNISLAATLTVVAAPPVQLSLIEVAGKVVLQWSSSGGTNLLSTPDLTQPWVPAGLPVTSANFINSVIVPIGNTSQFFRLLQ